MILEEKSQELKRRRWLEEREDEDEKRKDEKEGKIIKINETNEVKVINRIWAIPMENTIIVNNAVCIYRTPLGGRMNPNDI